MKKIILTAGLIISSLTAQVDMTHPLSKVLLSGDRGGHFQGEAWDSSSLEGRTTMLMYVDPDEKGKGEVFKPTIEAFERDLDFNKFQILVILNLKATWKPNALIKSLLKDKAIKYPKRTYILDTDSALVNEWGLNDDEYNTLLIDKKGKVVYSHSGEWKDLEIPHINSLIRSQVNN